jgi:hypothetical protein
MTHPQEEPWSPARDPYAIAVSQSWWTLHALMLFASQARSAFGPEQQIYARQIFGQLRLLRLCAEMQAKELRNLGVAEAECDRLDGAIKEFDEATFDAKSARDMLEHFDEYARGEGRLQQKAIRELRMGVYDAAALYWGGGYDPSTEQLQEGPFVIDVPVALSASEGLYWAIYAAGRAVDAHGSRGASAGDQAVLASGVQCTPNKGS